jgi:hypothetical protein
MRCVVELHPSNTTFDGEGVSVGRGNWLISLFRRDQKKGKPRSAYRAGDPAARPNVASPRFQIADRAAFNAALSTVYSRRGVHRTSCSSVSTTRASSSTSGFLPAFW